MPSWEEMCQQIVIDGRPGDVTSAAFGWEQLLKNLNTVKQNLETNVKDLGETWKGPAYEAFKTHIEGIAKSTGEVVADAESRAGIVNSLKDAADKLSAAQAEFPIPASCVNDVLEARNARITISAGFFEMKVKPDFLGLADPISSMVDWFNDKTGDATKVYQQVSGQYLAIDGGLDAPTSTTPPTLDDGFTKPDLGGGGGGGGGGGVPDIGGAPSTGGFGGNPSLGGVGSPPGIGTGGPGIGTGTHRTSPPAPAATRAAAAPAASVTSTAAVWPAPAASAPCPTRASAAVACPAPPASAPAAVSAVAAASAAPAA